MTDFAASPAERRAPIHQRHQNLILVVAGALMAIVAAAIIYSFASSGGSKTVAFIRGEVQGQFRTQDVSCRGISFSVPTLTRQKIYACDAKGVAQTDRPRGHIHDNAFTRCYIQAVNGQVVDVSHALSIEAKIRHKTVPCR
jgi:hypothetical protein